VRASFTVAWINARAKAPRTAGERLVKPAAVKIAMVMCSDAVAQGGDATKQHCQAKWTYNQNGQRATIACVKLCGLDKSRLLKIGNTLNLRSLCVCLIKSLLFHNVWIAQRFRLSEIRLGAGPDKIYVDISLLKTSWAFLT